MAYSFEGSLISFDPAADVFAHKGFQKSIKAWTKKYKDLNMMVELVDDTVVLKASYAAGEAKRGDVKKRLETLFVASNGVVVWTEHAEKEVEEEFIKKVDKMKLTYMNPAAFEELATVARIERNKVQRDGVAEGAWKMGDGKTGLNYGDRVVFEYVPQVAMLTNEERAALMPIVEKWVKKKS